MMVAIERERAEAIRKQVRTEKSKAVEGMRSIGAGPDNIAEAFKAVRVPRSDSEIAIKELTQTVQVQTQALNNLIQFLTGGTNYPTSIIIYA
ncbi:hypothetical protein PHYPSEUDO_014932 [Phytophthora pseudosyringae]|uniref:Uncharacterized protein n=1 Tax=Phytophthora pseudosyringae TaxID=221518 RepID=A0A8T1W306_9STRA|nr:hypothetical protein PHYPSEUDO_014932 [Phytophthora pseudosyringae]